jgi:dTDP-4-amino-4,6-dideoxygalactose transaminase
MKVPLLDLKSQYLAIKPEIDRVVAEVMESQHFIMGPQVQECEKAIAEYSKCSHAIGVSSGTDALLMCLMAEGIGPGDEVITTPYTFFATAGAISRVGAKPVFVDIEPTSYNIDCSRIAAKITPKTKALIPVHLYGQMADMDAVMAIANKHKLLVIEDAAQAIGAEWNGRRAGSIGHYGCFSFFPSKNLGAAGDGGMVVTNDAQRADNLARIRVHGSKPKYYHKVVGGNFRLDTLQAGIVSVKLKHLDNWTQARQRNAARYDKLLAASGVNVSDSSQYSGNGHGMNGKTQLLLPKTVANRHIFNQYVIRTSRRDALKNALQEKGIATEIYYPVPMHLQECFASLDHKQGDFPHSEGAAKETLALPIYPELTDAQAQHVTQVIRDFFAA